MKSTAGWAFLRETVNRFLQKSPKYFATWQKIGIVIVALSTLPDAIKEIPNVVLPPWAIVISAWIVKVTGAAIFIWSKLTVDSPVIAGTDLKKPTDPTVLPYTAEAEKAKPTS